MINLLLLDFGREIVSTSLKLGINVTESLFLLCFRSRRRYNSQNEETKERFVRCKLFTFQQKELLMFYKLTHSTQHTSYMHALYKLHVLYKLYNTCYTSYTCYITYTCCTFEAFNAHTLLCPVLHPNSKFYTKLSKPTALLNEISNTHILHNTYMLDNIYMVIHGINTIYIAYTLYSIYTIHSMQYTMYNAYCIAYEYCIVCTVHCIVYTAYCILYTVQCTICMRCNGSRVQDRR